MNYILYNPKSNSEHNDLNIIPGKEELERRGAKQISLLDIDADPHAFYKSLTAADRLYVCGGDGTLHNFANNTRGIDFPCPVFAIRSGTGNDFLTDLGQNKDSELVDIREHIVSLPRVEVDGESRSFINGVGMGIDGTVCVGVEEFKKNTGKKANYTLIALQQLLFKYKRPSAAVTVDGETHSYKDVWMICAMHGRYEGGGMMIAPTQDRRSGKLSLMVMHGGSRAKILTIFLKVFKGTHIKHKDIIDIFECDEATVTFETPVDFQADGETKAAQVTYSVRSANAIKATEAIKEAANVSI